MIVLIGTVAAKDQVTDFPLSLFGARKYTDHRTTVDNQHNKLHTLEREMVFINLLSPLLCCCKAAK